LQVFKDVYTLVQKVFLYLEVKTQAIFLAALTGGLADLGYFLFLDLGGYVNFIPGTLMTLISGEAIVLSFYSYFTRIKNA
jgi:hypothetical protein